MIDFVLARTLRKKTGLVVFSLVVIVSVPTQAQFWPNV